MNTSYDYPGLDTALSALANQKRRGIVHHLSLQPATVSQLAAQFDISLPAIHKHIRALERANLLTRKKAGRTNFVALNNAALGLVQHWIMQYRTEWGSTDATLDNYISRMRA